MKRIHERPNNIRVRKVIETAQLKIILKELVTIYYGRIMPTKVTTQLFFLKVYSS